MDASPRVGIKNVTDLGQTRYESLFAPRDADNTKFQFRYINAKIKMDGIPMRFGFDESCTPFVETSRSGLIYHPTMFVLHAKNKPDSNPRKPWMVATAYKYQDLATRILNLLHAVPLHKRYRNLKVHAECLPRCFQDANGRIVTLPYTLPEGAQLVMYPYHVDGDTRAPMVVANEILLRAPSFPYDDRRRHRKEILIENDAITLPLIESDQQPYPSELSHDILSGVNLHTPYGPIEGVIIPTDYGDAKVQSPIYKEWRSSLKIKLVVEE